MSVREYVGARYVPLFAEPLTWDATRTYEPLTVVLYQGNSFTSRQAVPANIDISNTTYWAQTGNYNAQIEQYRAEVQDVADDIDSLGAILPEGNFDSTNTVKKYVDDSIDGVSDDIESLGAKLPDSNFTSTNTVKKYVDDSINSVSDDIESLGAKLPDSNFTSTNTVKKYVDDSIDLVSEDIAELGSVLPNADFDSTNTVKKYVDDSIEDSYAQALELFNSAVNKRNHQGGFNIIGEFDLSAYGSVQGCTWITGNEYVVGCSVEGTNNVNLFKWNAKTHTISGPTLVAGYHDNSITYMPETDELYICETFDDANWGVLIPTITVVKYSNMTFQRRITVPMQEGAEGIYGLAYDRKNKIFYATCWRGSTEGQSNRIYKYDKTLTQFLGAFNIDDYTARYFATSSSQGVQYVYDDTLFEIYYTFGLIAGFDVNTGEKKILFNVPTIANKYRFIGELEGFAINEDTKQAICFTGNGAFECGIYKDVFEDKLIDATYNLYDSKYTLPVYSIPFSNTTPATISKQLRTGQDGVTFGAATNSFIRVQYQNQEAVTAEKHTLYVFNFNGEIQFGGASARNTLAQGVKIANSNVSVWGAIITGKTNLPPDLTSYYGCIAIYNSRVRLFGCTLNNSEAGTHGVVMGWNSILMNNLNTAGWNGKDLWVTGECLLVNFADLPTIVNPAAIKVIQ